MVQNKREINDDKFFLQTPKERILYLFLFSLCITCGIFCYLYLWGAWLILIALPLLGILLLLKVLYKKLNTHSQKDFGKKSISFNPYTNSVDPKKEHAVRDSENNKSVVGDIEEEKIVIIEGQQQERLAEFMTELQSEKLPVEVIQSKYFLEKIRDFINEKEVKNNFAFYKACLTEIIKNFAKDLQYIIEDPKQACLDILNFLSSMVKLREFITFKGISLNKEDFLQIFQLHVQMLNYGFDLLATMPRALEKWTLERIVFLCKKSIFAAKIFFVDKNENVSTFASLKFFDDLDNKIHRKDAISSIPEIEDAELKYEPIYWLYFINFSSLYPAINCKDQRLRNVNLIYTKQTFVPQGMGAIQYLHLYAGFASQALTEGSLNHESISNVHGIISSIKNTSSKKGILFTSDMSAIYMIKIRVKIFKKLISNLFFQNPYRLPLKARKWPYGVFEQFLDIPSILTSYQSFQKEAIESFLMINTEAEMNERFYFRFKRFLNHLQKRTNKPDLFMRFKKGLLEGAYISYISKGAHSGVLTIEIVDSTKIKFFEKTPSIGVYATFNDNLSKLKEEDRLNIIFYNFLHYLFSQANLFIRKAPFILTEAEENRIIVAYHNLRKALNLRDSAYNSCDLTTLQKALAEFEKQVSCISLFKLLVKYTYFLRNSEKKNINYAVSLLYTMLEACKKSMQKQSGKPVQVLSLELYYALTREKGSEGKRKEIGCFASMVKNFRLKGSDKGEFCKYPNSTQKTIQNIHHKTQSRPLSLK